MPRSFPRVLLAALFGAVIGAACLASLVAWRPGIFLEMDRDVPRPVASGFYPAELGPDVTFAWTRGTATLTLPGLPRGSDWVCQARVRGGRPAGIPQPAVELRVDGVPLASRVATNDYETLSVTAPARPSRAGLQLSVVADPTFVPSPSDPRQLGVQVDSLGCAPRGGALAWPPRPALFAAAAVGALFGATFSLLGIAWWKSSRAPRQPRAPNRTRLSFSR